MTICPRCGLANRPGTPACQRCGTQLAAMPGAMPGSGPLYANDATDGLPEWLRPLQSGGLGSPPDSSPLPPSQASPRNPAPYNQPNYNQQSGAVNGFGQPGQQWQQGQPGPQQPVSMGSLVSEDALPEWLRQTNGDLAPQGQAPTAGWGAPAAPPQPQYNGFGGPSAAPMPTNYSGYGQNNQYGYGAQMPSAPAYGATGGVPQSQPLPPSPYGQMPLGAPPANAFNAGTPASTLFDESALPDWMRQAGAAAGGSQSLGMPAQPYQQAPQAGGYNNYQGYQPPSQPVPGMMPMQSIPQPPSNAFPSIDRAGAFQPAPQPQAGLAGKALLDSGALPQWLSGQSGAPAQGGYAGGGAGAGGMAAQSLVDESALPQWLRAQPDAPLATSTPHGLGGSGMPPQAGGWGAAPTPAAEEALPSWLSKAYADANVPRTDALQQASANPWGANGGYRSSVSVPLANGSGAGRTSGGLQSGPSGVSASQFVDESALPDWLRAQGAPPTAQPQAPTSAIPPMAPMSPMSPGAMPGMGQVPPPEARPASSYVPAALAGTPDTRSGMSFSASDLIDPDVLPQWVRGGNGNGNGPAPQATFSSSAGWTNKGPAVPTSGLLPPPPAAPASSWQQPGANDHLAGWQSDTSSSQLPSRLYDAPPSSRQLDDDSVRFGGGRSQQGRPIPAEELPPWLQHGAPGAAPSRAANHPMDAGRQHMANAGARDRVPQGFTSDGWDNGYGAEGGGDFAWDDDPYVEDGNAFDEQGYGYDPNEQYAYDQNAYDPNAYDQNAYDQNAYGAPPQADERPGGWRRLFGRR